MNEYPVATAPPRALLRVGDLLLHRGRATPGLPPGQREVGSFPRYATHFPSDPAVPEAPSIEVVGSGIEPVRIDGESLARMPRTELVADFHCVAGWSARGLRWEGVALRDLYETLGASPDTTHVRACGRDGFRAVLALEDALGDDVLIADRLDGALIPLEHGGPWRLISASQYGYKSVKHLDRIEVHAGRPSDHHGHLAIGLVLQALAPHPRARVWNEERHRLVPPQLLRWVYRSVAHPPFAVLSRLGARRTGHR